MEVNTSCPPGAGGVPKGPVTRALIKDIVSKSLSEMGYECPESELNKFVRTATPVASRTITPVSSANSSRAHSPARKSKGKRTASSSSEEDTAGSDSTVVGSDDESGSATKTWDSDSPGGSSRSRANSDASFSLVKGKNKKAIRKATKKLKLTEQPASIVMDVEVAQAPSSTAPAAPVATPPTQVAIDRATPRSGAKLSAPPTAKVPPHIFLRKGANFVKNSTDSTRLHINYSKAVQFHTYALEEERKIKAVIRGIPVDFALDDIKNDLVNQGFPVLSVHRMSRRDGSPLWMVLAILERTVESKKIFSALSVVCGLSGIRVEAPFKKGRPGQCHRCQKYRHAAVNCHADPRCIKCLVPHWTKKCPLTRESEEKPSCVNCGQRHTANYRGCPRAPKFTPRSRPGFRGPPPRPRRTSRDLENFPALATPAKRQLLLSTSAPPLHPPPTRGGGTSPRGPCRNHRGSALAALPRRSTPRPRPRVLHHLETTSKL
ncbi:Nucleic-acid-binding protein from transposon X-element [Eumeta japonica]|uniref:Nucleic-acid-binding protein from transposon X-element n=1 Tax=Eumeta variegata TaxID=151549 RepID=A0A4C1XBK7_EUMVA|nr:Nucleic-acid-binding protein from transposon X-element [Eumeta japonica]